jgi:cytoskeleton protein RodZ
LPQEADTTAAEETELPDQPVAVEPEVEAEPEPEPEAVALPIVETDALEMSLSITYSGDCWTEITDAGGRRLFFDLGKAGRTVNLAGEAPFNVLFGDAANVSLVVNGASFDIPARDLRGRTARLTITSP